jgi:hypothetical protein
MWQDPPILLVAEVRSRSYTEEQWPRNFLICEQHLHVPEFLDFDPEKSRLRMWRLGAGGYELVAPEANGRLRSQELGLEFGVDEYGRLRVYTLDGAALRTYAESERDREEAEARATAEAELRRELERQIVALRAQLERQDAGEEIA